MVYFKVLKMCCKLVKTCRNSGSLNKQWSLKFPVAQGTHESSISAHLQERVFLPFSRCFPQQPPNMLHLVLPNQFFRVLAADSGKQSYIIIVDGTVQ